MSSNASRAAASMVTEPDKGDANRRSNQGDVPNDRPADGTRSKTSRAEKRSMTAEGNTFEDDHVEAKKLSLECQSEALAVLNPSDACGTSSVELEENMPIEKLRECLPEGDNLTWCPSLVGILSLLEYEDHNNCRLVNHELNDVIRINNFKTEKLRCEGLTVYFQKSIWPTVRVSITLTYHGVSRPFVITHSYVRRGIEGHNVHSAEHPTTNDVTLKEGAVEGIERLITRLAIRYYFVTIDISPCRSEEFISVFADPCHSMLECRKLTLTQYEGDSIFNSIVARDVYLKEPIEVNPFLERNEIWDRTIIIRNKTEGPSISFAEILELLKKWRSGACDRLLYLCVRHRDWSSSQYIVSVLQSIHAFYIGECDSYVKAYIRRERNSTSFEEGTESVLCFERTHKEYLLREINYSGPFEVEPVERLPPNEMRLDFQHVREANPLTVTRDIPKPAVAPEAESLEVNCSLTIETESSSTMDDLSSCPSILEILALLEDEDLSNCRLMNHRLNDVIRRNHFDNPKIPCERLSICFPKAMYTKVRVSLFRTRDVHNKREFLITNVYIRKRDYSNNPGTEQEEQPNRVTLTGGVGEGIWRLISRLATRYHFVNVDIDLCPVEEWVRAFTCLPLYYRLHCTKLRGDVENTIFNAIIAQSLDLHNPRDVPLFLESNDNWDRMIFVRTDAVDTPKKIWYHHILDLINKWRSGDGGRLLYFSFTLPDEDPPIMDDLIPSLQCIPAFYIGHEDDDYVMAYIRRERNSMSFEEGTESVLCFEWKRNEYLLREVDYSGSFDDFTVKEVDFDRDQLDYMYEPLTQNDYRSPPFVYNPEFVEL